MKKYIFTYLFFIGFQLSFSQTSLDTAQIQAIIDANSASEGDLYLDSSKNILYIGVSSGGLWEISKPALVVGGEVIPEVSKPLLYLDTSSSSTASTNFVTLKSFTLLGGVLDDSNAVRIVFYKRRTSNTGSCQIRLRYGGQTLFTTANLGNEVGRVEMILFATGNPNAQRAYIDDANTGNGGQRTGTSNVNSANDQLVEIQLRTNNGNAAFALDFISAEGFIQN